MGDGEDTNGTALVNLGHPSFDITDEKKRQFAREYHELCCRMGTSDGILGLAYRRVFHERPPRGTFRLRGFLKDPVIDAHLTELRTGVIRRHQASVDRVIEELERIAFANPMDVIQVDPETGEARIVLEDVHAMTAAAIGSVKSVEKRRPTGKPAAGEPQLYETTTTTTVSFHDKNQALSTLSEIFGLKQNRLTITVDQLNALITEYESGMKDVTPVEVPA